MTNRNYGIEKVDSHIEAFQPKNAIENLENHVFVVMKNATESGKMLVEVNVATAPSHIDNEQIIFAVCDTGMTYFLDFYNHEDLFFLVRDKMFHKISHREGSSVTIIPRQWLNLCDYEVGRRNTTQLIGATGARLVTEQHLVNARIVMKVDGKNDIPLQLMNVFVTRRNSPYIILGTPDLRNGSQRIKFQNFETNIGKRELYL